MLDSAAGKLGTVLFRVTGLLLGHSFLGWGPSKFGTLQRMGGKSVLPQPQETRMCVRRSTLTLRVPEEEAAATATGPSQTPVDVPRQSGLADLVGGWSRSEAVKVSVAWTWLRGEGGMEQFLPQGELFPSLGPRIVDSEGWASDGVQGLSLRAEIHSLCWS